MINEQENITPLKKERKQNLAESFEVEFLNTKNKEIANAMSSIGGFVFRNSGPKGENSVCFGGERSDGTKITIIIEKGRDYKPPIEKESVDKWIDVSNFTRTLRVNDIYKELGPESREYTFDIPEVVSNLDKVFSGVIDSWDTLLQEVDRAFSGKSSSMSTIDLPPGLKEKYRSLIIKKIKAYLEK